MKRLAFWLPPLAWMVAITWFSTGAFSADNTGSVLEPLLRWLVPGITRPQLALAHTVVRKSAHVTEYAVLALLWFVALARERRWPPQRAAWGALLVAVLWAFVDELHQATEPTRTSSPVDVAIDAAGALAAVALARAGWHRGLDRAAGAVLWIAALGGAAVVAVNLASGVGSGVLWMTVPVAAVVLALRRRRLPSRDAP